jgi:ribonuclease G
MSKEIYISSTPHETRLAIVEKDELTEIYYERENEYTLAGSIYKGKVTRVLPGMQSSFVDIGLERDAFLYITDFLEESGESADFDSAENNRGGREGSREGREGGRRNRREGRRPEQQALPAPTESGDETAFDETEAFEPRSIDSTDGADGETGEGAPGADGTRRWRGRRGRRRGRGQAADARASASLTPAADDAADDAADADFAIAPISDDDFDAPVATSYAAESNSEPRSEFRSDRDRGGRNRRGRGERGERNDRGERSDRAPRDHHRDGNRLDIDAAAEPTVEPFILPGESLSKYRRGEANETSAPSPAPTANVIIGRPSTEVELPSAWDGGFVLPGETLSRRQQTSQSASSHTPQQRSEAREDEGGRGRDRRRSRDAQRGRSYADRPAVTAADLEPNVSSAHDTAEAEYEPSGFTPLPGTIDAEPLPLTPEAAAMQADFEQAMIEIQADIPAEAPTAETVHEPIAEAVEFHETVTEYEPEDNAAASFRVDPVSPSEFRQSAPTEEMLEEGQAPELAAHLKSPVEDATQHETTSIGPTGEMLSTSSPQHEAETSPEATNESSPRGAFYDPATAQGFAPGEGELEEELLDDEEHELHGVHASAFDDDTEEETLENAADLGSMIREMTIDEITGAEPSELEEDELDDVDFDDEDFEEDELESTDEEDEAFDDSIAGSDISEAEEEEFAEAESFDENGDPIAAAPSEDRAQREGGRRRRRGGRGRGRDRNERGDKPRTLTDAAGEDEPAVEREVREPRSESRGEGRSESRSEGRSEGHRDRRGMANARGRGRSGGGSRSMQSTDLPAISDLLKPGQEVLVQIAKEPIAKKGARITSHIALPGRFLVFMPTVNHTGVSRKIESDGERRRLKEILLSEKGDAAGGFIVRTAASGASEEELRSDLRFLLNLWADIKNRSESSKAPSLIYHDLNLVERILRDQVTDNFSAIWVDTETEYERVLRFLQRFQPSLIRRVKLYVKDTPLFEQFGITEEINKALRSKVWLKSGGSIVINQTEALVAIDINTGKYVGKTARLEDTIVKTNLDAIPEIVRQIRLRDLGGIIIIDFIDMDERKNRNKVMAALEEELKKDRAPSKVLQFNDFGLVAITRKRVKQSLERTLSTTCNICAGTGMVKSPVTVCNDIYIEMRKMHKLIEKGDIMLRVHPEVVKQLKSGNGKWLQEMEELSGKTILVKSDPSLHPEQFDIH